MSRPLDEIGTPGTAFLRGNGPGGTPDKKLTLEHAKNGYKNAQDTVRLIDTKTTFLTTLATLTIGFVLQAVSKYAQLPDNLKGSFELHPWCLMALQILTVLSLFVGVICLWCCATSLGGRPPRPSVMAHSTILFPFFKGHDDERTSCASVRYGMTEEGIAKEYESQLWNIGLILYIKLRRHRMAIWFFLLQLALLTTAGIIAVFCVA